MKKNNKSAKALTPAQQALITNDMLAYAEALVKKQTCNIAEYDELIASAYLALCEAALNFKPDKDASFKSYATLYIRHNINKTNADATHLGITYIGKNKVTAFALDAPLPDSKSTAGDCLADEEDDEEETPTFVSALAVIIEQEEVRENKRTVKELMGKLNKREREVLMLHYGIVDGERTTVKDIAQKLGLTRARVNELLRTAMMKIENS